MIYVIESVRNRYGDIHERELRRKGRRVAIIDIQEGSPLFAVYVDDGNNVLTTSSIRSYEEISGKLVVTTKNTVYTFLEEVTQ